MDEKNLKYLAKLGLSVSVAAHNMRNIGMNLSGGITRLKKITADSKNTEEIQEWLDCMGGQIERMFKFSDDILLYSEMLKLDLKPMNAHEFLKLIVEGHIKMANLDLGYGFSFCQKLNEVEIMIDFEKIQQCIENIITNARDEGATEIVVETSLHFLPDINEKRIALAFKNNGRPINETDKEKIFNLFYTTKESGSGLGLSFVKKIVKEHGGLIDCESNECFTTFRILLPVVEK